MKYPITLYCILFILFSCGNTNHYKIKGKLSNLEVDTLFFVYETPDNYLIDTVLCKINGEFSTFHEQIDDLQTVSVYYNHRTKWFKFYPEAGKPVQVKGDAHYPLLLQIQGGQINNALAGFTKKTAPLLKELTELQNSSLSDAAQLTNLNHEIKKSVTDFVSKNPDETASVLLVSDYFILPDESEQIENLLQMLSPELNNYYLVKNLKKELEKVKTTKPGAKAPDFMVTGINGQTFTANSFKNKYFILAFTALWCDMCQTEMMALDEITSKYAKDSLEILLISLDDELNEVREWVRQDSIQWNVVADSAGQAIRLFDVFNVTSLPKCLLVDKKGIIVLNTRNAEELKQCLNHD